MDEVIDIAGRQLPVTIVRSSRARRAALRVDAARGEIRLTLPSRVAVARGRQLIEANRGWIADRVACLPRPRPIMAGGSIPFRGRELLIDWRQDHARAPLIDPLIDRLIIGGPSEGLDRRVQRWLRRQALELLTVETRAFARMADRPVESVRIGDPMARWGSCSARGRIAYGWRLVMAPEWVRRSVVAHEVAHLVHLNHSGAFHALHRQLLGGDPGPASAWLAANGPALYWVGRAR